eukprot:4464001-Amphidinium_carterae.1
MKDPDYEAAVQTVEDCYRNVYTDNEQGDLNAFKGKYGKGKGIHKRKTIAATCKELWRIWQQQRKRRRKVHKHETKAIPSQRQKKRILKLQLRSGPYSNTYGKPSPNYYTYNKGKGGKSKGTSTGPPIPQQRGEQKGKFAPQL